MQIRSKTRGMSHYPASFSSSSHHHMWEANRSKLWEVFGLVALESFKYNGLSERWSRWRRRIGDYLNGWPGVGIDRCRRGPVQNPRRRIIEACFCMFSFASHRTDWWSFLLRWHGSPCCSKSLFIPGIGHRWKSCPDVRPLSRRNWWRLHPYIDHDISFHILKSFSMNCREKDLSLKCFNLAKAGTGIISLMKNGSLKELSFKGKIFEIDDNDVETPCARLWILFCQTCYRAQTGWSLFFGSRGKPSLERVTFRRTSLTDTTAASFSRLLVCTPLWGRFILWWGSWWGWRSRWGSWWGLLYHSFSFLDIVVKTLTKKYPSYTPQPGKLVPLIWACSSNIYIAWKADGSSLS